MTSSANDLTIIKFLTVAAVVALLSGQAFAADCNGVARTDAHAIEDPGSVLRKGSRLFPITEMQQDRMTMALSYCAQGSYCYPAGAIELQSCVIGTKVTNEDEDDNGPWLYDVTGRTP